MIFMRKRNSAKMLHKALVDLGYEVTSMHGALEHEERDKIVKEFRDGLTQVLISTDVLARGLDKQQVLNWFCFLPLIFSLSQCREKFRENSEV